MRREHSHNLNLVDELTHEDVRVRAGREKIGEDTVRHIFGEVELTASGKEMMELLGLVIERIGLNGIKRV